MERVGIELSLCILLMLPFQSQTEFSASHFTFFATVEVREGESRGLS